MFTKEKSSDVFYCFLKYFINFYKGILYTENLYWLNIFLILNKAFFYNFFCVEKKVRG